MNFVSHSAEVYAHKVVAVVSTATEPRRINREFPSVPARLYAHKVAPEELNLSHHPQNKIAYPKR